MNRQLAQAVIDTFGDLDAHSCRRQFSRFGLQDWRQSLHWLDASGLALYFLDRLKDLGAQDAIPFSILNALEMRVIDNKQRTAQLFEEFQLLNEMFTSAGLPYANVKGFAIAPDYCRDPSLRCQFDLDFLVSVSHSQQCRAILEDLEYRVTGSNNNVLEFKAGEPYVPSIRELYKPRGQRSVEVHFVPASSLTTGHRPTDIQNRKWNGTVFPAPSDAQTFLLQAQHLLRHMRSEWTRISWLLEFKTFVTDRYTDQRLWQDVYSLASSVPDGSLAIGAAIRLATVAFGPFAPAQLSWASRAIANPVKLWFDRYGRTILLSDFPGTKLYLLLDRQLSTNDAGGGVLLRKLIPLHGPPRIAYRPDRGFAARFRAGVAEARFVLFRLRFHIAEGLRYLIEAQRWKRAMVGTLDCRPSEP